MSTATYLGSAIIDIEGLESTHPDPFHALCPLCKTQTTRLSKEILTTDNFHRLEGDHRPQALVSPSAWKQKSCLETILLGGGKVRQRLKVPGLQVTKNIPFLRLLNAPQLAEFRKAVYGSRIPSIEVDLYQDDGSGVEEAKLRNPHRLMVLIMLAASGGRDRKSIQQELPCDGLLPSHVKDAINIGRTPKLSKAMRMRNLTDIHPLWLHDSLGYWNRVRKTKFQEECVNYITYISDQVQRLKRFEERGCESALNHITLKDLESRYPHSSQADQAFVDKKIDSSEFLPSIEDPERREELRQALYTLQGPFLTLRTLGEDLKVLQRTQGRLAGLLNQGEKKQSKKQTARQYFTEYFGQRFQELYKRKANVDCWTSSEQFVARCYEMLFLHLLRTVEFNAQISEADLMSLAERVFVGQPDRTTDTIKTVRSAFSDAQEGKDDIAIDKRHGMALFGHPEATRLLYTDNLQRSRITRRQLRPAHLSRDIACIFLYGKVFEHPKALVHSKTTCSQVRSSESSVDTCPTPIEQRSCTSRLQEPDLDADVPLCAPKIPTGRNQAFSGRAMPVNLGFLRPEFLVHKNAGLAATDVDQSATGYYGTSNCSRRTTTHTESRSSIYDCSDLEILEAPNPSRRPRLKSGVLAQSLRAISSEIGSLAGTNDSNTLSMTSGETCIPLPGIDAPHHEVPSNINIGKNRRLSQSVLTPSSIYSSETLIKHKEASPRHISPDPFHKLSTAYLQFGIVASDLDTPTGNALGKPGLGRADPNIPITNSIPAKTNPNEPELYVTFIATEHWSGNKIAVVKFTEHYIKTFYHNQRTLDNRKESTRFWHWKRDPGEENFGQVEYRDLEQLMSGIEINRPKVIYIQSSDIGWVDTTRFGASELS